MTDAVTTAARWIDQPSRLAPDDPLGAGQVQIAASNSAWASRRNSLRTLWEHPGSDNIGGDLAYDDNVDSFPWDTDPAATGAVLVLCIGTYRLRAYGETGQLPRIECAFRLAAPSTYTAGVVFVARSSPGRPTSGDLRGTFTTTSTTLVDGKVTLTPTSSVLGSRTVAPRIGTASPVPEPPERGEEPVVTLYLGAWRTGGVHSNKATLSGVTVYLLTPT